MYVCSYLRSQIKEGKKKTKKSYGGSEKFLNLGMCILIAHTTAKLPKTKQEKN